jgi:hypothetical protein
VVLTVADCERQLALKLVPLLASGQVAGLSSLRVGGLRAGWGETTHEAVLLRRYSYVSGVTVSGRLTASEVVLHVGGPAAAAGTLSLGRHSSLSGVLGGVGVHLNSVVARGLDVGAATAASAVLSRRASAGASAIRSSGARAPLLAFAAR